MGNMETAMVLMTMVTMFSAMVLVITTLLNLVALDYGAVMVLIGRDDVMRAKLKRNVTSLRYLMTNNVSKSSLSVLFFREMGGLVMNIDVGATLITVITITTVQKMFLVFSRTKKTFLAFKML